MLDVTSVGLMADAASRAATLLARLDELTGTYPETVVQSVTVRVDAQLSWEKTRKILLRLRRPLQKDAHCGLKAAIARLFGADEVLDGTILFASYHESIPLVPYLLLNHPVPNDLYETRRPGAFVQLFVDARRVRGGPVTNLPARLLDRLRPGGAAAAARRPKINTLLIALINPDEAVTHDTAVPILVGLLNDHAEDLSIVWRAIGEHLTALILACRGVSRALLLVWDGSTYAAQAQMSTNHCPACLQDAEQYTHAGPVQYNYPPGVSFTMVDGVPFVNIFNLPRSVWRGFPLPWSNVVWGPGHLLTEGMCSTLSAIKDRLDHALPGRSPVFLRMLSQICPFLDEYDAALSWDEAKTLFDSLSDPATRPMPGEPLCDAVWSSVFFVHDLWRRPPKGPLDACSLFKAAAEQFEANLFAIYDAVPACRRSDLKPKVHYLVRHLPRIWAFWGGDLNFPRACSDEPGESNHVRGQAQWCNSTMTMRNPATGQTGLTECLANPLTRRVLVYNDEEEIAQGGIRARGGRPPSCAAGRGGGLGLRRGGRGHAARGGPM